MKKIILAFDGTNFSEGAFEFARRLNKIEPILLTGIFMPQTQLANLWSYSHDLSSIPLLEDEQSKIIEENISKFEKRCQANRIDFRVHKDYYDFVIPELSEESRYADLLIIGSEAFYAEARSARLIYLQQALHDIKCPVIIVPEQFEFPKNIILAYDGSDDSIFAIKQFAYLFPRFTQLNTLLVYAKKSGEKDIPDKGQMEELVARHYKDLTLFKLDINPKKFFSTWIMDHKTSLLVSGSFGRSGISQLFRKSFVKDIIEDHRLPVFIAHQ